MMQKKKTLQEQPDLIKEVKEQFGFQTKEMEEMVFKFQRYDPRCLGYVVKHEVDDVLRDMGMLEQDKVIKKFNEELAKYSGKFLDFKQICELTSKMKQEIELLELENSVTAEYIDAFVALGGNFDRSGRVSKQKIINIVQNEFQLTFDMKQLLSSVGNDEDITFEEFSTLFEKAGDDGKSMISAISERGRSNSSFHVKYRDFEKWITTMEQKIQ